MINCSFNESNFPDFIKEQQDNLNEIFQKITECSAKLETFKNKFICPSSPKPVKEDTTDKLKRILIQKLKQKGNHYLEKIALKCSDDILNYISLCQKFSKTKKTPDYSFTILLNQCNTIEKFKKISEKSLKEESSEQMKLFLNKAFKQFIKNNLEKSSILELKDSLPKKIQTFLNKKFKKLPSKSLNKFPTKEFTYFLEFLEIENSIIPNSDLHVEKSTFSIREAACLEEEELKWIKETVFRIINIFLQNPSKIEETIFDETFKINLNFLRQPISFFYTDTINKICNFIKNKINHISSIDFLITYIEDIILKNIDNKKNILFFKDIFKRLEEECNLVLKKKESEKNIKIEKINILKNYAQFQKIKILLFCFIGYSSKKNSFGLVNLKNETKSIVLDGAINICSLLFHQKLVKDWIFKTVDFLLTQTEEMVNDKSTSFLEEEKETETPIPSIFSFIPLEEKIKITKQLIELSSQNRSWLVKFMIDGMSSIVVPHTDPFFYLEKMVLKKDFSLTYEKLAEIILNSFLKLKIINKIQSYGKNVAD